MRVAINAWFLPQETTGSGQYLTHLLPELSALAPEDEFVLIAAHPSQLATGVPDATHCEAYVVNRDTGEPREHSVDKDGSCRQTRLFQQLSHLSKVWFEQVGFPRACRRLGVDLAHVPYWGSPLFPTVPTVVTVHDLIPLLLPAYRGKPLVRLYTRLVSVSARRAAAVLTDSVASQQDIIRHLRIPPERVYPVLLAADERYRPVEDPEALSAVRARYALPERYFLYLGGFDQRKNVPVILRAYARFRQLAADNPVRLVVAGKLPVQDTPFFPDPRRIAHELHIAEEITFAGWIPEEDKPALYSSALALIFPSRYEGFGLPPLEAMACGTPVIASNRGSLPEVVGEGGLLLAPDDIERLAWAMHRLASSEETRLSLREQALSQAARFSWRKAAQETHAVYETVYRRQL
ncbi:MAG: glycosyltransferase family 4 protein [Anaerolineae bacterium]|nr:glycosyltransferase family 4 protein [Anaerolineae bacterium]